MRAIHAKALCLALAALAAAGAGCGGEGPASSETSDAGECTDPSSSSGHDAGELAADGGTDAGAPAGDAGPFDGGDDMPVYVPGETYYQRLLERRKSVDLLPWMELYTGGALGCLAPAAPANSQVNLSIKRPYALDLGDLTIAGIEQNFDAGAIGYDAVPTLLMPQVGPLGTDQAIRQFADVSLIGDADNGWWGLGAGSFYGKEEVIRMQANTVNALGAAGGGAQGLQLHIAGRGYREYQKGTVSPVQYTRAEYAAMGYGFDSYSYGGRVSVPAATPAGIETSLTFTFDRDFLADEFTLNVFRNGTPDDTWANFPGASSLVLVSFDTDRTFFSDKVSRWAAVGEPQPRTAWRWLLPVTFSAGTTINFRVTLPVQEAVPINVDFVLHGHILRQG